MSETAAADSSSADVFVAMVNSDDAKKQLSGVTGMRVRVSTNHTEAAIDSVIESGVVPRLVQFLDAPSIRLQYEAAWAICNIASGSYAQTLAVVNAGAVPPLVRMLESPIDQIREQAMWALGNIVGDSVVLRDVVLATGALPILLDLITDMPAEQLLRAPLWIFSNLFRTKPLPHTSQVFCAMPVLAALALGCQETSLLCDVCWALAHLGSCTVDRIQRFLDSGVLPRVIQLTQSPHSTVAAPALRCVGNCLSGSDDQTQAVLDAGGLAAIVALLGSDTVSLRKDACWALSNIASGIESQVQALVQSGVVPTLVSMMHHDVPMVRKEACWTLANATRTMQVDHIRVLVENDAIEALATILFESDRKILHVALEGLDNMFRVGASHNLPVGGRISDAWVAHLTSLGTSLVGDVQWRAASLLEVLNDNHATGHE